MKIPVVDRLLLADLLPIAGTPVILQHGSTYCLASVLSPSVDDLILETRLSQDFSTRHAAEQYFTQLVDLALQGLPVWPRILASCLDAPLLAPTLPPLPSPPSSDDRLDSSL